MSKLEEILGTIYSTCLFYKGENSLRERQQLAPNLGMQLVSRRPKIQVLASSKAHIIQEENSRPQLADPFAFRLINGHHKKVNVVQLFRDKVATTCINHPSQYSMPLCLTLT